MNISGCFTSVINTLFELVVKTNICLLNDFPNQYNPKRRVTLRASKIEMGFFNIPLISIRLRKCMKGL